MIITPCVQGGSIGQSAENFIPNLLSDTTGVWLDPSDIRLNWRRNFARYSEDVTNAAWVKSATTASASNLFVETAVSGEHFISQTVTMGGICTFTFEVKDSSTGRSIIRAATGSTSATYGVVFDLNSNAFSTIGTAIISCTSTVLADGYTRISITSNAGVNQIRVQATSSGTTTYVGDITKGLYVRNLQVEYGSTFTGYQKITDGLADYSTYTGITIPTMYQDSVGTTTVSQVEQQVGLILDKSKRLVLGSEIVTNGTFDSSTGWTLNGSITAISGGILTLGDAAVNPGTATQTGVTLKANTFYKVSFNVVATTSGSVRIYFGAGAVAVTSIVSALGSYTFYILCPSAQTQFTIQTQNNPANISVDNVSIKEITGNHAYQATTNSRPYLRARQNRLTYSEQIENSVWTKSNTAIQSNLVKYSQDFNDGTWTKTNTSVQSNLLTYSQQFDNAAWTKRGVATAATTSAVTAPDGTSTAILISNIGASGVDDLFQNSSTAASGVSLSPSFYIYKISSTGILRLNNPASSSNGVWLVDLSLLSSGWERITSTHPAVTITTAFTGSGATNNGLQFIASSGGPLSFYLWGSQLILGTTPGNYRATTTTALPILFTGPDGTTNASLVIPTTTSGTHKILQTVSVATTGNLTYSVYVKAAGYNYVAINESAQTGYPSQILNLTDGTLGGNLVPGTTTIVTALSNGWYRLVWKMSTPASPKSFCIVPLNATGAINPNSYTYAGDGTSGIYIANSQVVNGDVPGDYQRTLASSLPLLYAAPDETLTAQKLLEDGTNNEHRTYFTAVWGPATYTYSIYLKAAERTFASITHLTVSPQPSIIINLSTGEITSPTNVTTSNAVNAGNGWWRVSMTYTNTISTTGYPQVAIYSAVTTGTYTGDGSSGIYIWGGDVRIGNTAGKYQRTTATAWNTVGTLDYDVIGQQPYLWFDGTDDSLVTNNVSFTSTDKITVCAGVTKLSDAVASILCELSTNIATNDGTFYLAAPEDVSTRYSIKSRGAGAPSGSQVASTTSGTYLSPVTNVLTATFDIAGDSNILRLNGTQINQAIGDQGTGNFGAYPLYIGRRGGSTLPFTGQLYNLVIAGKTVTSSQLTTIEKYVSSKTDIVI
jgi:hypothetical protein